MYYKYYVYFLMTYIFIMIPDLGYMFSAGSAYADNNDTAIHFFKTNRKMSSNCKLHFNKWKKRSGLSAFAVSRGGACGYGSGFSSLYDAGVSAVKFCRKQSKKRRDRRSCKVIAVKKTVATGQRLLAQGYSTIREQNGNTVRFLKNGRRIPSHCMTNFNRWKAQRGFSAFAVSRAGACGSNWGFGNLYSAGVSAVKVCRKATRRRDRASCKVVAVKEPVTLRQIKNDLNSGQSRKITLVLPNWHLPKNCQKNLKKWLKLSSFGAFAASRNGACGTSSEQLSQKNADETAIINCQFYDDNKYHYKNSCKVIAQLKIDENNKLRPSETLPVFFDPVPSKHFKRKPVLSLKELTETVLPTMKQRFYSNKADLKSLAIAQEHASRLINESYKITFKTIINTVDSSHFYQLYWGQDNYLHIMRQIFIQHGERSHILSIDKALEQVSTQLFSTDNGDFASWTWYFNILLNVKHRDTQAFNKMVRNTPACQGDNGDHAECIYDSAADIYKNLGNFAAALEFQRALVTYLEKQKKKNFKKLYNSYIALADLERKYGVVSRHKTNLKKAEDLLKNTVFKPEIPSKVKALLSKAYALETQNDDPQILVLIQSAISVGKNLKGKGWYNHEVESLFMNLVQKYFFYNFCENCKIRPVLRQIVNESIEGHNLNYQPSFSQWFVFSILLNSDQSIGQQKINRHFNIVRVSIAEQQVDNVGVYRRYVRRKGYRKSQSEMNRMVALTFGFGDVNPKRVADFLLEKRTRKIRKRAKHLFSGLQEESYGQWGNDLGFWEKMYEYARELELLGFNKASYITLEALIDRMKKGYSSEYKSKADQKIQTKRRMMQITHIFVPALGYLADHELRKGHYNKAQKHLDQASDLIIQKLKWEWAGSNERMQNVLYKLQPVINRLQQTHIGLFQKNQKFRNNNTIDKIFQKSQLTMLNSVVLSILTSKKRSLLKTGSNAVKFRDLEQAKNRVAHFSEIMRMNLVITDGLENAHSKASTQQSTLIHSLGNLAQLTKEGSFIDPVPLRGVMSGLSKDEALIMIVETRPKSLIIAINQKSAQIVPIKMPYSQIVENIKRLRHGIQSQYLEHDNAFSLKTAHVLFQNTLGQVEKIIDKKRNILVISSGAFSSIPFHLLVSENPLNEDYRQAEWLVKRYAFTHLPSIRNLGKGTQKVQQGSRKNSLIGFGDPVFQKNITNSGYRGIAKAPKHRRKILEMSAYYRGASVNLETLRQISQLPDTRDELHEVSQIIGQNNSQIFLGKSASESTVKRLSQSGELAKYNIVYFATHAIVSGVVTGLSEPALILTLPDKGSEINDGLLTASEVAKLKMNADWVVLSACDTAASDKPGAQALSGLAKAFFKAGAKTLLVSHWPVLSDAATRLTTKMFKIMKQEQSLSKAEALRISMLELLNDPSESYNANPIVWAPFVVVGDR